MLQVTENIPDKSPAMGTSTHKLSLHSTLRAQSCGRPLVSPITCKWLASMVWYIVYIMVSITSTHGCAPSLAIDHMMCANWSVWNTLAFCAAVKTISTNLKKHRSNIVHQYNIMIQHLAVNLHTEEFQPSSSLICNFSLKNTFVNLQLLQPRPQVVPGTYVIHSKITFTSVYSTLQFKC